MSPGARLLEIDGADHLTVVTNAEFVRTLRELLDRAPKTLLAATPAA